MTFFMNKSRPTSQNKNHRYKSAPLHHAKEQLSDCEFIEESLTLNEKNNINLLNTKLDEQARLLLFYKKRGDEYSRKNVSLENLTHALIDQRPIKFFRIDNRRAHLETEFISKSKQYLARTDTEIMRTEISEQNNLINFYKQRSENYIKLNVALEKHNSELTEKNTCLGRDLAELTQKFDSKREELETKILELNNICNEHVNEIRYLNIQSDKKTEAMNVNMEQAVAELKRKNELKIVDLNAENDKCVHGLKKELKEFEAAKQSQMNTLNAVIDSKNNEILMLVTDLEKKNSDIKEFEEIRNEKTLENANLCNELAQLKKTLAESSSELDSKTNQINMLIKEKKEKEVQLNKLVDELNEKKNECFNLNSRINEKTRDASIRNSEMQELKKQISELNAQVNVKDVDLADLKSKLDSKLNEIANLNAKIYAMEVLNVDLKADVFQFSKTLDKFKADKEADRLSLKALSVELDQKKNEISNYIALLSQNETKLNGLFEI